MNTVLSAHRAGNSAYFRAQRRETPKSAGLDEAPTASLAQRHLKDPTSLLTEIRQIIPQVVAPELAAQHPDVDVTSATESLRQTEAAWP